MTSRNIIAVRPSTRNPAWTVVPAPIGASAVARSLRNAMASWLPASTCATASTLAPKTSIAIAIDRPSASRIAMMPISAPFLGMRLPNSPMTAAAVMGRAGTSHA